MAEQTYFWDYVEGDGSPEYTSAEFTRYFSLFLTEGVYTDPETESMGLGISMSGLTASRAPGYGLLSGRLYVDDAIKQFALSPASSVAGVDRIDRIVLRKVESGRKITAELKQGISSSAPIPPALTQESDIYEIPLAQIRVRANASTGIVTDERQPVSSLIKIPIVEFRTQFSDFLATNTTLAENQRTALEGEFDTWFAEIQDLLNENVAANLLAMIEANTTLINSNQSATDTRLEAVESDKMEDSRIHLSTGDAVLAEMQDGDIWIKYG